MLFGKKPKAIGIPNDIMEFLFEADKLYIRAFETRNIVILKEHFTRDCCIALSRVIVAEAASRYFSNEKFRNTTWSVVQATESLGIYRKSVIFENIRVHGDLGMKVSQDFVEDWTVSISDEDLFVTAVAQVV